MFVLSFLKATTLYMVLPMQKKNSVKKKNRGSIISVLVLSSEVLQLFAGILTCSTKSGPMVEEIDLLKE